MHYTADSNVSTMLSCSRLVTFYKLWDLNHQLRIHWVDKKESRTDSADGCHHEIWVCELINCLHTHRWKWIMNERVNPFQQCVVPELELSIGKIDDAIHFVCNGDSLLETASYFDFHIWIHVCITLLIQIASTVLSCFGTWITIELIPVIAYIIFYGRLVT